MRQLKFAPMIALLLVVSVEAFQANNNAQSSAPAQAGQPTTQKAKAQSACMEWAKEQVGLSQSSNSQQASTGAADKTGAAPAANTAAAQPASNASPAGSGSSMAAAAEQLGGSMGGAANSKMTQLVENAYSKCMHKKGYQTK